MAGAILLAAGAGALLFAGHRAGGPGTLPAAGAALVLFAAFVAVERRAAEPVLPLALFARPVLLTSSLTGAIIGGAMIATMTYVPLFVQGVLRGSPTDASTSITPMVIGWPLASALSGRLIPRVGFRPLIRAGLSLTAIAALSLALFAEEGTLNGLRLTTLLFGVGMGLSNTALVIAVQSSVEWHERGVATASTMFFRTLGGLLAVGALGGVINAALARDPSLPLADASRLLTPEGAARLGPALVERLGQALGAGLGTAFWIIAAMGILGFAVALRFPRIPVRAKAERVEPAG